MVLHHDLLALARELATKEPKRPRQATLRRAISSAYYALFHSLVSEGALALAPAKPAGLRSRVQRAYAHATMREVCDRFSRGDASGLGAGTKELVTGIVASDLVEVAQSFGLLQEARHRADYDTARPWQRVDVLALVARVEETLVRWQKIRGTDNARVFLTAMLLQRWWGR